MNCLAEVVHEYYEIPMSTHKTFDIVISLCIYSIVTKLKFVFRIASEAVWICCFYA